MPQRPMIHSTKPITPSESDLANSFLRKILPPSPLLPRLYEDYGPVSDRNSNQSNTLAKTNIKISSHTNRTHMHNSKRTQLHPYQGHRSPLRLPCSPRRAVLLLPPAHDPRRPHSLRVSPPPRRPHRGRRVHPGRADGSHQRPPAQHDRSQARSLILRALNIASRNIRHMKFGIHDNKMVREVPDYPAPPEPELESVPAPAQWSVNMTPAEVAAKIRADRAASTAQVGTDSHVRPTGPDSPAGSVAPTTTQVGTDAPVRPSGPDSPGRSALPSTPASASTSRPKPPASVKENVRETEKEEAAPKERKTTAHRASGG